MPPFARIFCWMQLLRECRFANIFYCVLISSFFSGAHIAATHASEDALNANLTAKPSRILDETNMAMMSYVTNPGASWRDAPSPLVAVSATLVRVGHWGGDGISLNVTAAGADLEFDCAFATIDAPLTVHGHGAFEATGVYAYEMGGPRSAATPASKLHPALFEGQVDGTHMRLTVTLVNTGREIGVFELEYGRAGEMDKCV